MSHCSCGLGRNLDVRGELYSISLWGKPNLAAACTQSLSRCGVVYGDHSILASRSCAFQRTSGPHFRQRKIKGSSNHCVGGHRDVLSSGPLFDLQQVLRIIHGRRICTGLSTVLDV